MPLTQLKKHLHSLAVTAGETVTDERGKLRLIYAFLAAYVSRLADMSPEARECLTERMARELDVALPVEACLEGYSDTLRAELAALAAETAGLRAPTAEAQAVGWLWQFLGEAEKERVFAALAVGKKISSRDLPAATQLFTPDWAADYLTENTLGRLWCRFRPQSRLRERFLRYVEAEEGAAPTSTPALSAFTVCDPCVGTGHLLLRAFDLLLEMYREEGIAARDAAPRILSDHLFGIDIDGGAVRVARLLLILRAARTGCPPTELPAPHIHALCEDIGCGSLYLPTAADLAVSPQKNIPALRLLSRRYAAVITNPPYMGKKSLPRPLADWLKRHYPDTKSELYAAFMLRCLSLTETGGLAGMLTMHGWMFLRSFAPLRRRILSETTLLSLVHTGAATFEELSSFNVLAAMFVLQKTPPAPDAECVFIGLSGYYRAADKPAHLHDPENRFLRRQACFWEYPDNALLYRLSEPAAEALRSLPPLRQIAPPRQGMATSDNRRFVRHWFEVPRESVCLRYPAEREGRRWFPYNKGGAFRKWYGMNEYVVDWEEEGRRLREFPAAVLRNTDCYFLEGITWSLFGFENFGVRYKPAGFLFDVSGSSMFPPPHLQWQVLAYLCSKPAFHYLSLLAPTVNFQVGNVGDLPFPAATGEDARTLDRLARENVGLAREDWDEREDSWDFGGNPLALAAEERGEDCLISALYTAYRERCERRFGRMKRNQERINEIYIRLCGLTGELTPTERDADISLARPDGRQAVTALLSYAVGCLLGRYTPRDKGAFPSPVPCLDFSEGGDTVSSGARQIAAFIGYAFGESFRGENLRYIAAALEEKKGDGAAEPLTEQAALAVIERYFRRDFYHDHLRLFSKKPLYWRFAEPRNRRFTVYVYYFSASPDTYAALRAAAEAGGASAAYRERLEALAPVFCAMRENYDDGIIANYLRMQAALEKLP